MQPWEQDQTSRSRRRPWLSSQKTQGGYIGKQSKEPTAHNFVFSVSQIFGGWGGSINHRRTLAHARVLVMLWEFLSMFFSISCRCSDVFSQYSLHFGPQLPTPKPIPKRWLSLTGYLYKTLYVGCYHCASQLSPIYY